MGLQLLVMACVAAGIAVAIRSERKRRGGPVSRRGLDGAAELGGWLAGLALLTAALAVSLSGRLISTGPSPERFVRLKWVARCPCKLLPAIVGPSQAWTQKSFVTRATPLAPAVVRVPQPTRFVEHRSLHEQIKLTVPLHGFGLWVAVLAPLILLLVILLAACVRYSGGSADTRRSMAWGARLARTRLLTALRHPVLAGSRPRRWALLLVPVLAIGAELVGLEWLPGQEARTIAVIGSLLAAALALIVVAPAIAADLAVFALLVLGAYGLMLAGFWPGHVAVPLAYRPDALFGAAVVNSPTGHALAGVQGLLLLGLGVWLVPRTAGAHLLALRSTADAELTRRFVKVAKSRADAVDIAAANLRRLERDLHDGAQARLVALGMSLRAAERLILTNPEAALALVAEARDASARALSELRELVRGVHPPVLADRGLADAIRALALDSPLYVQTEIDLAGRPPAPVETACYFAVAELLTNAAKHSGARQAAVSVSHADGRLRIEVTDFGLGGADAARGSGLAGVEKRLASFDGILAISSPVGGPTIVVLEVPCVLSSLRTSSS
jgi:signal transduction histidine kinase